MGILQNIKSAVQNRTTYRAGILQDKAYRVLKQRTNRALATHGITSVHWAFLGMLFDARDGLRGSELAAELGVEAPFVTAVSKELGAKGLISSQPDPADSRAKILRLTPQGKAFVSDTEGVLRAEMRPLVSGASPAELLGYISILERIIENDEKLSA